MNSAVLYLLTVGATKNVVSGNQVTPGSLAGDFIIGGVASGAGAFAQKAAQASNSGKVLVKNAKRLTNIANTGRTRAAQTARAASAQTAAQTFGGSTVATSANATASGVVANVLNPGQSIQPGIVTNPTALQPGVANSDNTRTVVKLEDVNK